MMDELGEKILEKFVGLRAKPHNYLIDYGSDHKTHKKACHENKT